MYIVANRNFETLGEAQSYCNTSDFDYNMIQETKEQTQIYTYYYRLRPPMPGGQPKNGLIETNSNEIIHNNRTYWGTATYNRELTPNELYEYDLD